MSHEANVEIAVPEVPTQAQVDVAAETFRMLSSSTRLFIVWHLLHGERDVSSLAEECGVSVQVVSQHLAKMRLAGLVSSRRDGKHIFYVVDDPHVVTMVAEIFDHIAPDGSLAPDPGPRTAAPLRVQADG
ncbi:ArsR/SmtB family transcription factor [Brevibacterium otitidis]|uniref:ArsR/SmtB family transcription factor n=2 Tax=Brevibacterium otitidis TaxID=53364 RepID=A0ABV5X425_9MICO